MTINKIINGKIKAEDKRTYFLYKADNLSLSFCTRLNMGYVTLEIIALKLYEGN